jgi:hypothetical protein
MLAKPATNAELDTLLTLWGYALAYRGHVVFVNKPGVDGSRRQGFADWPIEDWVYWLNQWDRRA